MPACKETAVIGVLWAACLLLACARPFMPTHQLSLPGSYEAAAHLFVGGLIGAWLADRSRRHLLVMAGALTAVEVLVFVWNRTG